MPPFDMGLPSINVLPTTPSSKTTRAADKKERDKSPNPITPPLTIQQPVLRRTQPALQRVPLYHAALQEQAQRQRQSAMAATARRLGLPVVIVGVGRGREDRGSVETMGSDVSGYDDNGRDRGSGPGGNGDEGGMGTSKDRDSRTLVMHSTRASSEVFPEERDEEEEWEQEEGLERTLAKKWKEKDES
jgi:hypothetical protein